MPIQEATFIAYALLYGFFTKYRTPSYVHSDHGTQFESRLFQEVCQILGIKKTLTTPFCPQYDGQSHHGIKTFTKMLAMATKNHLLIITVAY